MAEKPFQINSITFPLIGKNYLDEGTGYDPLVKVVQEIKALGVDHVRIVTSLGEMRGTSDNNIRYADRLCPSDDKIAGFAKMLKDEGVSVSINPFVHVKNTITQPGQDWRANPQDMDAWWPTLWEAVLAQARLAERVGATHFMFPSDEIQHMVQSPDLTGRWVKLLQDVRKVYSGQISTVLGTNGEYDFTYFIPQAIIAEIDVLGVGYFPDAITNEKDPTVGELVAGYYKSGRGVNLVQYLKDLHEETGKPIFITDKAFHSFDGSNIDHFDIFDLSKTLKVDQQEQADLYESFLRVMSQEQGTWFQGVSFQNWNRFAPGTDTARFLFSPYGENIEGKLAEGVLRSWYTGEKQGTGLTLKGSEAVDDLEGGYHHDNLTGLGESDTLWGGAGKDRLDGGSGDDKLDGGTSADLLMGGLGDDLLDGGAGKDTLTGGGGADRFLFASGDTPRGTGRDVIRDFSVSGGDLIHLSLIDANTALSGNQAFTWKGTAAFSGGKGQLHMVQTATKTIVEGDVNGDKVADFQIELTGKPALTAADFVL